MKICVMLFGLFVSVFAWAGVSGDCQVASYLVTSNYLGVYQGECQNGLAHGEGQLKVHEEYTSFESSGEVLEGLFRSGVFLGSQSYSGDFLVDGIYVSTQLGEVEGAEVWFHATADRRHPIDLCKPSGIRIGVDDKTDYAPDDEAKRLFVEAYKLYEQRCSSANYNVPMGIYPRENAANSNVHGTNIYAELNHSHKGKFVSYSNDEGRRLAFENSLKAEQKARAEAKRAVQLKAFSFFEQSGVDRVVSVDELDKNPFLYEGKIVALLVSLSEMHARNIAVVNEANYLYGSASLWAVNVEPDYFSGNSIVLVAKVAKEGKVERDWQTLPEVEYVDHYVCETEGCEELYNAGIETYAK